MPRLPAVESTPDESVPAPPLSAIDLVQLPDAPAPDASAAREALANGARAPDETGESTAPGADQERAGAPADRRGRRSGRERRSRPGGHKPTKTELETQVRELRQQLEAVSPDEQQMVASQIAHLQPALAATFSAVFGLIAKRRGDHWRLVDEERAILSSAWAPCLAPYMDQAGAAVPWIAAAAVTWGVIESRVEQDQRGRAIASGAPSSTAIAA